VKATTLQSEVRATLAPGATLNADAWVGYRGLHGDYQHQVIDHAVEYVRGTVHTNGIENFWSLLKRTIKGTYVSIEPFHLGRYLDEQVYRFNERERDDYGRFKGVAIIRFRQAPHLQRVDREWTSALGMTEATAQRQAQESR